MMTTHRYFHVCEGGLLPDVMHDVLEGALQYEVKIMLQAMVEDERYLTLNELNSRLGTVELGYMEAKDRPSAIGDQKLSGTGHTLNQAGIKINYPIARNFNHFRPLLSWVKFLSCDFFALH